MRIQNLFIEENITNPKGLKPLNLKRLGSVIALVGRNGSGKTRTLKLIEERFLNATSQDVLKGNFVHSSTQVDSYIEYLELLSQYEESTKTYQSNPQKPHLVHNFNSIKKQVRLKTPQFFKNQEIPTIATASSVFDVMIKSEFSKYIFKIENSEILLLRKSIDSTEKGLTFEDIIENISEKIDVSEFALISKTALNYLFKLPHELVFDFDDCYGNKEEFHKKESYKRFSVLQRLIKDFLNKEFSWKKISGKKQLSIDGGISSFSGSWTLDDRVFLYDELSDGERTLFTYCLLFFLIEQNPNTKIGESIIIIDEPELHLHPESELALVEGLRKVVQDKGQLWIATHSINILSSLNYDEVFMVRGNEIIPPSSRTPSDLLNELMGLNIHIERLSNFITNISEWAYVNFVCQCFTDPDVIATSPTNDPQISLFKEGLFKLSGQKKILDFGAGKGRLLKEIVKDEMLKTEFECYALEPSSENRNELEKFGLKQVFSHHTDLPKSAFNYVVLCNVLHEIPVTEWKGIFNSIFESLVDDGFLLILEDLKMPKGEMIGRDGFLILDLDCLKELFSLEENPVRLLSSEIKYKDRILCSLIPKQLVNEVTNESIQSALVKLQENSIEKIKTLRSTNNSKPLSLGREAALYSQLYINSFLALESLKSSS